jgi:hypothetical protein
MSAIATFPDDS